MGMGQMVPSMPLSSLGHLILLPQVSLRSIISSPPTFKVNPLQTHVYKRAMLCLGRERKVMVDYGEKFAPKVYLRAFVCTFGNN